MQLSEKLNTALATPIYFKLPTIYEWPPNQLIEKIHREKPNRMSCMARLKKMDWTIIRLKREKPALIIELLTRLRQLLNE